MYDLNFVPMKSCVQTTLPMRCNLMLSQLINYLLLLIMNILKSFICMPHLLYLLVILNFNKVINCESETVYNMYIIFLRTFKNL